MFVLVNGSEDLALLPDGLVFVSSVSAFLNHKEHLTSQQVEFMLE